MMCDECGKLFSPSDELWYGTTAFDGIKVSCSICGEQYKNIGEEKMEANGRVRLKIVKNSKGWSYEFTIEQGNDGDLKRAMFDTLQETRSFKMDVESMIQEWELGDVREARD